MTMSWRFHLDDWDLRAWVTTKHETDRYPGLQEPWCVALCNRPGSDPRVEAHGPFTSLEEAQAFAIAMVTLSANTSDP